MGWPPSKKKYLKFRTPCRFPDWGWKLLLTNRPVNKIFESCCSTSSVATGWGSPASLFQFGTEDLLTEDLLGENEEEEEEEDEERSWKRWRARPAFSRNGVKIDFWKRKIFRVSCFWDLFVFAVSLEKFSAKKLSVLLNYFLFIVNLDVRSKNTIKRGQVAQNFKTEDHLAKKKRPTMKKRPNEKWPKVERGTDEPTWVEANKKKHFITPIKRGTCPKYKHKTLKSKIKEAQSPNIN